MTIEWDGDILPGDLRQWHPSVCDDPDLEYKCHQFLVLEYAGSMQTGSYEGASVYSRYWYVCAILNDGTSTVRRWESTAIMYSSVLVARGCND